MVVSLIFGEENGEGVVTRASPLAELGACLHAFDAIGHHPRSRRWAADVTEGLGDGFVQRAWSWAPLWGAFRARYLLPLSATPAASLEAELAEVAALPVRTFAAMTAQALIGKTTPDPGALLDTPEVFVSRLRLISVRRHALGSALVDDPQDFRTRLLAFLSEAGETAFDAAWAELRPVLEAGARTWAHRLLKEGPGALRAFPTGRVRDDPPRADFDKFYTAVVRLDADGTVLVPSVHLNPHFVIKHYPGHPVVIQYAVINEKGTGINGRPGDAGLTLDEVRRRLAVLHDPFRLELCHSMLRNAMTTTELATRFQMTVPQMSRHLRHLREAGLVHTHRDGPQVHYQLDQEALRRLGTDLLTALHR